MHINHYKKISISSLRPLRITLQASVDFSKSENIIGLIVKEPLEVVRTLLFDIFIKLSRSYIGK